jgi:1-acyl-sn-glycerol-3-phosphate acyltransferase
MFPEGRRREGPVVEDLFDGPAYVACRERVPIVPIGIGGSDRAMPIGSKMVLPRKIVVVVGEPIYPEVPLEGRVPRSEVTAFTAQLQERLQALYDDAKARAGG